MKHNIEFWQLFCWRLLRPANDTFLKLINMPKNIQSQDSKTTFKQNLSFIFLSARVNLKGTLQYETPCNKNEKAFSPIEMGDKLYRFMIKVISCASIHIITTARH